MCRIATAALAALLLAAPAAADDDSPAQRRLAAKAAEHNARTWVRLRDGGERYVWVDAKSAAGLKRRSGRPRTVVVLWLQDPETAIAHVGTGVAWTIAETTVHCADRSATERRFHFGDDERLMAAMDPVREDMAADDLLYDMVCKGFDAREAVRKETALGVSNYEAAGATDGPAAPGSAVP